MPKIWTIAVLGRRGGGGGARPHFIAFYLPFEGQILNHYWLDTLLHDTPKTSLSEIRSVPRCTGEQGQDTRLNHDFFTWFKPRLNWSSNLNQNSSVWKSDHCFVGCSVGGRGSRRVSVGGEEGVSHISVAPKPASREDFDRFFVSISERFWHWGTSNFDIRAISVIDDFSVWVKKNLVTNKVFMCWDEDLHCFLDRISQASVRFWEWKRNSKEADETKKN